MQKLLSFVLVLMLAVTVTACGKKKAVESTQESDVEVIDLTTGSGSDDNGKVTPLAVTSPYDPNGIASDGGPLPLDPNSPNDPLGRRVVYFEYDSSTLTSEGQIIVEAHANWLAQNVGSIVLEGHTDERGTREYNLALGEDRAATVARLMQALGVSRDRQQMISYGEERPIALGSDESSWGLNRRVELLYGQ